MFRVGKLDGGTRGHQVSDELLMEVADLMAAGQACSGLSQRRVRRDGRTGDLSIHTASRALESWSKVPKAFWMTTVSSHGVVIPCISVNKIVQSIDIQAMSSVDRCW